MNAINRPDGGHERITRAPLLLATVALATLAAGGCGGSTGKSTTDTGTVAVPSTTTNTLPTVKVPTRLPKGVLAAIPLDWGVAPNSLTVAYGSVWVETHRSNTLYRIDPSTNRVIARIDVGDHDGAIGVAFGRLWLTPGGQSTQAVAVDPKTNQVVGSFQGTCCMMAFAGGSVWAPVDTGSPGRIARFDPKTYKPIKTIKVGSSPLFVLYAHGAIWVVNDGDGTVSRIEPATNKVVTTFSAGVPNAGGNWPVYAFGSLWLHAGSTSHALFKINPRTNSVQKLRVPGEQTLSQRQDINIAVGAGSLWVRTADDVVSRIDPGTGAVTGAYPADRLSGGGLEAIGFGSLWVTNFGADTVWRDRIAG